METSFLLPDTNVIFKRFTGPFSCFSEHKCSRQSLWAIIVYVVYTETVNWFGRSLLPNNCQELMPQRRQECAVWKKSPSVHTHVLVIAAPALSKGKKIKIRQTLSSAHLGRKNDPLISHFGDSTVQYYCKCGFEQKYSGFFGDTYLPFLKGSGFVRSQVFRKELMEMMYHGRVCVLPCIAKRENDLQKSFQVFLVQGLSRIDVTLVRGRESAKK